MTHEGWIHVPDALLVAVRAQYRLAWRGIHGLPHWERVRDNGRRLAAATGADLVVVEFFAALHDGCRLDDGHDPEHGARAARLAEALVPDLVPGVTPRQLRRLAEACRTHTHGRSTDDPTVATCWDADRLDLLRVGVRPDPRYLVTAAAKDPALIAWASQRALAFLG